MKLNDNYFYISIKFQGLKGLKNEYSFYTINILHNLRNIFKFR
jgi:hypothetical protein